MFSSEKWANKEVPAQGGAGAGQGLFHLVCARSMAVLGIIGGILKGNLRSPLKELGLSGRMKMLERGPGSRSNQKG